MRPLLVFIKMIPESSLLIEQLQTPNTKFEYEFEQQYTLQLR